MTEKVAFVLGAIKGIGKGIGLSLAEQGLNVALTYHDWEESLDAMRTDFQAARGEHLIINNDLKNTRTISDMVQQVVERFGRLDILINNIERGGWPVVHGAYTVDQWDLEQATTLRATGLQGWRYGHRFRIFSD